MKNTKEVDLALVLDELRILAHTMDLEVTLAFFDNDEPRVKLKPSTTFTSHFGRLGAMRGLWRGK